MGAAHGLRAPPRHGTSPTRSRSIFRRCNSGRSICRRVIHQILIETGLSPARLEVEITESTLIENLDRALHILRQIKALGVTIAMDDFGTGYSSLSTLHAFPFDKIKLDRSFVNKVRTEHQAAAIVRAVLSLGKSLHSRSWPKASRRRRISISCGTKDATRCRAS